jgi:hypothetical protein
MIKSINLRTLVEDTCVNPASLPAKPAILVRVGRSVGGVVVQVSLTVDNSFSASALAL